jgi:hypothetical protein
MNEDELVGMEADSIIRGHFARADALPAATSGNQTGSRQLVLRSRSPLRPTSTQDQSGGSPNQDAETESQHSEVPSPYEVLDSSNVNPFASMPVELSPRLMALLMDQSTCLYVRKGSY